MNIPLFAGINVVSISVPDLDRARSFYRDVLALGPPLYDLPDAGWIEFRSGAPSGNLALTKAEPGWQPSTGTTVVLDVADCHAACAELRRRGVRCDDPVVFPGYVTFCSFYDPFGNRLQMCSPAPDDPVEPEPEPEPTPEPRPDADSAHRDHADRSIVITRIGHRDRSVATLE